MDKKKQMDNTFKTVLNNDICNKMTEIIINEVASHLSEWLTVNKNIKVSVDEIIDSFGMVKPTEQEISRKSENAMSVPTYFNKSKRETKKSTRSKNLEGIATCKYEFTRGQSRGKICGRPVTNDSEGNSKYCKGCLRKQSVKEIIGKSIDESDAVKTPSLDGGSDSYEKEHEKEPEIIKAEKYKHNGLYAYHPETKFVIQTLPSEDHLVIGCDLENDGNITPLTDQDKKLAISLSLCVRDSISNDIPQINFD